MRIMFVNGSPRADGNTATILRSLAKTARDKGAEVTFFQIVDENVHDCDGCYRCDENDECSIDDDMGNAYAEIQQADVLVIGSPIYMGMETGLTKCFVDRLYYLMAKKRLKGGKKAVAIFTCGLFDGHMVYGYMHARYDKLLRHDLGFDEARTYFVPGTKNAVALDGNHRYHETMEEVEGFLFPKG